MNWIRELRQGQDKFCIFLVALLYITFLEFYGWQVLGDALHEGFYFQEWPSNFMMQTLNIENLRQAPLQSLFYLHIQPPMLDSIRAVLAQFSPYDAGMELELFVDRAMYFAWTVVFAILAVIVYSWTTLALDSKWLATVATLIWVLHPAPLAMATLLEGTLLSTLFITWLFFSLWCLAQNRKNALIWTSLAFILCFGTRTVFQWYSLLILAGVFVLIRVPAKKILITLALISIPVSALIIKQSVLFDTMSTTTFAGQHKLGIIWHVPTEDEIKNVRDTLRYTYPPGARIPGEENNTAQQAVTNIVYNKIFEEKVRCCLPEIFPNVVRSMAQNLSNFWLPTSSYVHNAILSLVFWRPIYDRVFSKWFVLTCFATAGIWLLQNWYRRKPVWPYVGLALMGLYVTAIILLSNRHEWVEAVRLKMFVEPSGFVFVYVQFIFLVRYLWGKYSSTVKDRARNIGLALIAYARDQAQMLTCSGQVLLFGLAVALIFLRRPDAVLNPQFYAEDGHVWYANAYNMGIIQSLFIPVDGYFQTLCRITGAIAQFLPLTEAPFLFTAVAIVLQALPVNVFLSSRFADRFPTLGARSAFAFVYLALPNSYEVHANLTYAKWHLALLAFLVIVARPARTPGWRVFDVCVVMLCSVSGPFALFLVPVLGFGYRHSLRSWRGFLIGLLAVGAVIQSVSLISQADTIRNTAPLRASLPRFVRIVAGQIFLGATLGYRAHLELLSLPGYKFGAFVVFVLGSIPCAWALAKGPRELRYLICFAILILAAALVSPMVSLDTGQWHLMSLPGIGVRYWMFPMLAFASALLWVSSQAMKSKSGKMARGVALLALISMPVGIILDWRHDGYKDFHFSYWANRLDAAAVGEKVEIPINPNGWKVTLTKREGMRW